MKDDLVKRLENLRNWHRLHHPHHEIPEKTLSDTLTFIKAREAERDAVLWLVWSNEHGAWWRDRCSGYTSKLENAGRYSFADAFSICHKGGNPRAGSDRQWPYEVMVPAPECALKHSTPETVTAQPAPQAQSEDRLSEVDKIIIQRMIDRELDRRLSAMGVK